MLFFVADTMGPYSTPPPYFHVPSSLQWFSQKKQCALSVPAVLLPNYSCGILSTFEGNRDCMNKKEDYAVPFNRLQHFVHPSAPQDSSTSHTT